MEWIDACNVDGLLTGEKFTREQIHRDGIWHRTVHLWVLNSKNQFLLQQRAEDKDTNPGQWDVSTAGHVSAGQSAIEAVIREAQEEIGLVVQPEELVFLFETKHEEVTDLWIEREHQSVYVWIGDFELHQLVCDPKEVMSVAWIDAAKLFELAAQKHPELVQHEDEYQKLEIWFKDRL